MSPDPNVAEVFIGRAKGISDEQRQFAESLQRIKPYYHRYYEDWPKLDFDCFYVMNSRR